MMLFANVALFICVIITTAESTMTAAAMQPVHIFQEYQKRPFSRSSIARLPHVQIWPSITKKVYFMVNVKIDGEGTDDDDYDDDVDVDVESDGMKSDKTNYESKDVFVMSR
jgi:hypothetical protein